MRNDIKFMSGEHRTVIIRSLKEAVRHMLHVTNASIVLQLLRNKRGADTGHLRLQGLKERFSYIYDKEIWAKGVDAPKSGLGSSLNSTRELVENLPGLLDAIGTKSVLDLGCGDFTWMATVSLKQDYTGADIVPSVIEKNRAYFPNHTFVCADATCDELPKADVVICREVLFHLSFADGRRLLENVRQSGAIYLLTTSEESTFINSDIRSGDYRPLNLRKKPFSLPAPIATIGDGSVMPTRYMGLWKTADLD
jgi:2-polyprenyl-3-methyl-5-hydroxy-6-metoxy-1,4-benzoquinol methylase